MPDTPVSLLTAYLWDLRAQCERQLRCLTSAQRVLDEYRANLAQTPPSPSPVTELRKYLGEVEHAHGTIAQSINDASAELGALERLMGGAL